MIVVADASVLVGELLRKRGRELFLRPELHVVVAEDQWGETEHELSRRLGIMQSQGRLSSAAREALERSVRAMIDAHAIEIVGREMYATYEHTARRRVPRDSRDWPVVALALLLDAAILTGDNDFLGCGCPTWTVETLRDELDGPEIRP
ncbi:MAG TPA: PIN domain-containing protein [Solirubrobacteraceae bacterium]|nr:PIN domain-containing protein [Solirubrobacteraceae bacterium]